MSVWYVCRSILVNRTVCQMGEHILEAVSVVSFGRKAYNSFLEEVDLQRTHLSYENVNPHIPLGASDQKRIVNVLLNYALLFVLEVFQAADDWDLAAAREVRRFANPHLFVIFPIDSFSCIHVYELLSLIRETKRLRSEVVNFAKPASISLD